MALFKALAGIMIGFCITCRNRAQHVKQTLPQNLASNPKSKFVIVNYNTEDDLLEYLFSNHESDIASGHLVVYSHLDAPKFRMSHAKNMAHRCAILEGADILVNLDADNITTPGFEDFVQREFDAVDNITMWAQMIKGALVRGVNGRIVVSKEAFLKSGGYDEEKFEGWGSDDKDFNIRLRALGYSGVQIPPSYLKAIPHNNKIRFKEYPHMSQYGDDCFAVNQGTVTKAIANNGRIGCGIVYRNKDTTPIVLEPIPTRIFGIGMHKTATTSLHHAMAKLGYDSWHWSSAHVAKAIWQEMNNLGYSPTLQKWDALCDLPIPMLYKQLDTAYPNSKFILTVRNETSWLEAVKKHFDPHFNKWQSGWADDPWTNRAHQILYGRTDFDAETFINRYRRHNEEVLEYFKNRLNDLLIMNMDAGHGWSMLCKFLDKPIPYGVPYPYENGSK